jgi:hypothetical protein
VIAANSVSQLVLTLMQSWDAQAPLPPLQKVTGPPSKKPAAKTAHARKSSPKKRAGKSKPHHKAHS